jgi:hypothetical protein
VAAASLMDSEESGQSKKRPVKEHVPQGRILTIIGYGQVNGKGVLTKQAQQPRCAQHALHCENYKMEASLFGLQYDQQRKSTPYRVITSRATVSTESHSNRKDTGPRAIQYLSLEA